MSAKSSLKTEIYDKLKLWDRKRAQILKYHKKATEQISEAIERKLDDSKQFLTSLETLLDERVNQLKTYCSNSVVDSSLVFDKNKMQSFTAHYEVLREAFSVEAQFAKKAYKKLGLLNQVVTELKGLITDKQSHSSENKNDESLVIAQGNIRYLIECQLPEIIEVVVAECGKLSKTFSENKDHDLYFAIQNFVKLTNKQTNKHREIGRELINFVSASMKREILVQTRVRSCLKKWSEIDGPIDPIFIQQLTKKQPTYFVKTFYDMQDMTDISYQQASVQDFLINFKIEEFIEHDRLKLCDISGFYNSKIESRTVITVDCFLYLIRSNAIQADFSQQLNPDLIVKKSKECTLVFTQFKKKFYFKKEKQYEFFIEFNNEEDMYHVKTILEKLGTCKVE